MRFLIIFFVNFLAKVESRDSLWMEEQLHVDLLTNYVKVKGSTRKALL